MRKFVTILAIALAFVGGGVASVAFAAGSTNDGDAGAEVAASPEAAVGAQTPNGRMAAGVEQAGDLFLKKGVQSVTHPGVGIYCITPKANKGIDVSRAIPLLDVDWGKSAGNELSVYSRNSRLDCPAGAFNVRTFSAGVASDSVAFTIVVP